MMHRKPDRPDSPGAAVPAGLADAPWSPGLPDDGQPRERLELEQYSPHLLRYDFFGETDAFQHNLAQDLNCFIVWEKGRRVEERIVRALQDSFTIMYCAEVRWSEPHILRNFNRLYNRPDKERSGKPDTVGRGPFLFVVVRDETPRYVFDRSVSGDIEIVNDKIVASKRRFRAWAKGKYLVHSSNNIQEFFAQAILVLGPQRLGQIFRGSKEPFNGDIIRENVAGADGWRSFDELFSVLNLCVSYIVLRNFEWYPDNFFAHEKDIDFLCARLPHFVSAANAMKRGGSDKIAKYSLTVSGQEIPIDVRFVGDGYYHELWQQHMLARRALHAGRVFVPRVDDYFFSLLYHAKIQKREVAERYVHRLQALARCIGLDWFNRDELMDDAKAAAIILGYMRAHAYHYVEPVDDRVVRNEAVLRYVV